MMEYRKINIADKEYPEKLRMIKSPPRNLYTIGNLRLLKEDSISVVGTRHITDYGERYGKLICKEIAARGITIVSGMAIGSDELAHRVALESSGKTIAVLPSGFENIFPKKNTKLFNKIVKKGGLAVSEYEPKICANSERFLERNRIVAGLGIGLFVIEALFRSGTSVTAKIAKEQGKDVFALPRKFR